MEEYIVIEHRLKNGINGNNGHGTENGQSNGKTYIIKAINFKLPSIITFSSSIDMQFDSKVLLKEDNKVYADEKPIGEVISMQLGTDPIVNTDYDIKYTGGYSKDGKIIYIDRDLPKIINIDGKEIDTIQSIARHHEVVEKWLIDDAYDYQYAHMIATKIERIYVESLGVKWEDYDNEVGKYLRQIFDKKLKKSPRSLDLSPYLAANDQDSLKEIRESLEI